MIARTELRGAIRRGIAWKAGALGVNQLLRLATLVIVARALSPREFGLAAMAMSFWAVAAVFTDLAFAAALVQRTEIDERDRSTAFWASVLSGFALALGGVAASGAVAAFFDEPDVQWLFAALALGVFLSALASTHVALLTRAMDFKTLELVSVAATVAGAFVGIGLALGGLGAWAVVANALAVSAVTCALVWLRSDWRPRLLFSSASLRQLSGFASLLSATRLVVALHRSADRLLIGRFLGAPALGTYAVPASIVFIPAARLVDPIRGVLFPAFAKLQRSVPELAEAWMRTTRLVCALLAPVLVTLALTAPEIVGIALTSRWSESATLLSILAVAGLFQLAGSMNAVVLAALDRLATVLRVFLLTAALSVVGFSIGKRFGIEGAVAGYAGATAVVAPFYVLTTARALRVNSRGVASVYAGPAIGILAMALSIAGVNRLLLGDVSSVAARLAGATFLGVAVYALVVLRSSRQLRLDLVSVFRPRT